MAITKLDRCSNEYLINIHDVYLTYICIKIPQPKWPNMCRTITAIMCYSAVTLLWGQNFDFTFCPQCGPFLEVMCSQS